MDLFGSQYSFGLRRFFGSHQAVGTNLDPTPHRIHNGPRGVSRIGMCTDLSPESITSFNSPEFSHLPEKYTGACEIEV